MISLNLNFYSKKWAKNKAFFNVNDCILDICKNRVIKLCDGYKLKKKSKKKKLTT